MTREPVRRFHVMILPAQDAVQFTLNNKWFLMVSNTSYKPLTNLI